MCGKHYREITVLLPPCIWQQKRFLMFCVINFCSQIKNGIHLPTQRERRLSWSMQTSGDRTIWPGLLHSGDHSFQPGLGELVIDYS